jgi:hypothetical protein
MDEMKGDARAILFVDNGDGRIQLVAYADESWGIVRKGKTVCTWESAELTDCLRTFLDMASRRPRQAADGYREVPAYSADRLGVLHHPGRLN